MSRIVKIARLPEQIREQINRRLQDGEKGRDIIAWLNALKEAKASLSKEFVGRAINDSNLSAWRLGGYRDWEAQQAALDEVRRVTSEGTELAKAGEHALADKLAVSLCGRYAVATRRLMEAGDGEKAWKLLRELCHDLAVLCRGDHGAEWLRLEEERLKLIRQKNARERKKLDLESKKNKRLPAMDDEEKDRRYAQIFGFDLETHPMYAKRKWRHDLEADEKTPPSPEEDGQAPTEADQTDLAQPKEEGVGSRTKEEDPEAREIRELMESAKKGDAYSAYCLGARYRDGLGVPRDSLKALEWLETAANQGIAHAKRELRAMLLRSRMEGRTELLPAVERLL